VSYRGDGGRLLLEQGFGVGLKGGFGLGCFFSLGYWDDGAGVEGKSAGGILVDLPAKWYDSCSSLLTLRANKLECLLLAILFSLV
jgi:hypothetical protein